MLCHFFQGGGGGFDGVQARYNHQCPSLDAAYSIVGFKVARFAEESDFCHSGHGP